LAEELDGLLGGLVNQRSHQVYQFGEKGVGDVPHQGGEQVKQARNVFIFAGFDQWEQGSETPTGQVPL
jgi:hypothetical protein